MFFSPWDSLLYPFQPLTPHRESDSHLLPHFYYQWRRNRHHHIHHPNLQCLHSINLTSLTFSTVFLLPPSIEFHFRLNHRPEMPHGRTIECSPTVTMVGLRSHVIALSVTKRANEYATLCIIFRRSSLGAVMPIMRSSMYPILQIMKSHICRLPLFDTKQELSRRHDAPTLSVRNSRHRLPYYRYTL